MKFKKGQIVVSNNGTKFKIKSIYNEGEENPGYILEPKDRFLLEVLRLEYTMFDGFWTPKSVVERVCKVDK
jgi:hypothetical protein